MTERAPSFPQNTRSLKPHKIRKIEIQNAEAHYPGSKYGINVCKPLQNMREVISVIEYLFTNICT